MMICSLLRYVSVAHMFVLLGGDILQPCELVSFITALACSISKNKTADQIELYGVIFTQLGDTLLTISTQMSVCDPCDTED